MSGAIALVALLQGLIVVFALFMIEVIVGIANPGWTLPFSVWLGMLASAPGLYMAFLSKKL